MKERKRKIKFITELKFMQTQLYLLGLCFANNVINYLFLKNFLTACYQIRNYINIIIMTNPIEKIPSD